MDLAHVCYDKTQVGVLHIIYGDIVRIALINVASGVMYCVISEI